MKKLMIKAVSLVLCAAALLSCAVLQSCTGAGTAPADTAETTAPAQTTEEQAIVLNGSTPYAFVRPDEASSVLTSAFAGLSSFLRSEMNWNYCYVTTDWVKKGAQLPVVSDAYEVLVGETNRAETQTALSELTSPVGYVIRIIGNKIVVAGTDEDQTCAALEQFKAALVNKGGEVSVPASLKVTFNFGSDGSVSNILATQYTVIVSSGSSRLADAADEMRTAIKKAVGTGPKIEKVSAKDAEVPGERYEILIGDTNRAASHGINDLTYQDYVIKYANDQIVIKGGSPYATERAVMVFTSAFLKNELPQPGSEYKLEYRFAEHRADSVIYHLDTFRPGWMDTFTPAEWMMDFNEKTLAVYANRRFCSDAHRGDTDHYPENSAEGIRSAAMMGVDCIEIDIRLSKDKVPVLSHDESLKRATNYSSMAGKKGLPASDKIQDWTYDQLLELNLLFDGKPSEYKICTLYEAAAAAGSFCFLHMDDKASCLDLNTDVYLLGRELGCKSTFLYYYGYNKLFQWVGLDPSDTAFRDYMDTVRKYTTTSGFSSAKRDFDLLGANGDDAAGWLKSQKAGIQMMFTNNITAMQKYIKENFKSELTN